MEDRLVTFLRRSRFEHVLDLLRTPENNENVNAISAARCFVYVKQVRHAVHSIPPRKKTENMLFPIGTTHVFIQELAHTVHEARAAKIPMFFPGGHLQNYIRCS
jgi:hypothetical protein